TGPELFLEPAALGLGERENWRPAADLTVQLACVRRPPPRRPAREPAPGRAPQRQADEERIGEEIDQVRLDGLERIGPAQVQQEDAGVRRRGARPERNHAARSNTQCRSANAGVRAYLGSSAHLRAGAHVRAGPAE